MNMFFKVYAIAVPVFFAIDMVWLGLIARNFYKNQIGFLVKPEINWTAAILFYLLLSGVPMLERKYEGNDDNDAYKKKTSVFFPLPEG